MILICLAALFYTFVSEVNSFVWLLTTIVLAMIFFWQQKFKSYGIIFILFFFTWYRISISEENDRNFAFPNELNQKVIEVHGTVLVVDSLDIQKAFKEKRQITFLLEIANNSIWQNRNCIKVVVEDNSKEGVLPGDQISVIGKFLIPFGKSVPGSFDSAAYYRQNKWLGKLHVRGWDAIEKKGSIITWRKWVYLGRKSLYEMFKKKLSSQNLGLISSIILGYTSDFDNELMVEFRQWGIAHIFSISGLHLGLVGFWVWFISGFFVISLKKRTILTILIAFSYCFLSGMAIATVRSFIMLGCFLSGFLVNRRTSLWNNYSLAFVLLFLWDPEYLNSAGFQLSFTAVAGILITQELLARRKEKAGVEILLPESRLKLLSFKLGEMLFYPMMISAATLGVTAYHFQMISFGSVILNFLVVPLFSVIMGVSFFYMFFLYFIPTWMVWPLEFMCDLFMIFPGKIMGGKGLFTYITAPASWLVVLLFLMFCSLALIRISLKKSVFVALLYFILAQSILLYQSEKPVNRLVMINVGSASACLVQNNNNENMLFDCGTLTGYDMISPYLRNEGINQLQAVVISHDNYDHLSCWRGIYKNFKVKKVWHNLSHLGETLEMQTMDKYCLLSEIPVSSAYAGERIDFGTKDFVGDILHPAKEFHASKNDESILVLLQTGWCEVLFPGDAQGIFTQVIKNELPPKNNPRILVFPHHGRKIKDAEILLNWFQPDIILISGKLITGEVKEALLKAKIPWYLTSEKGTIQVEPGLKIKTYNQGVWSKEKF